MKILLRFIAPVVLLLPSSMVQAQSKKTDTVARATVEVTVTDSKLVPLPAEELWFVSADKKYSVRTNAKGKATLQLPAGNTFLIQLKTLNDTANHSLLEIPALQPNQFFTEPFTVSIEYDRPRSFTLDHVHFDSGKPTLRADSFAELNEIAAYMKTKDQERYEIGGHTDNVGKEQDNLQLSAARALAVKNYLVKKGINAERLEAKGYGSEKPVAPNDTEEGRQKNRRTEVVIR